MQEGALFPHPAPPELCTQKIEREAHEPCLLPRVLFLSVCGLLSRQLKLVMGEIVFIIREEKQRAYLLQTTMERRKIK